MPGRMYSDNIDMNVDGRIPSQGKDREAKILTDEEEDIIATTII